MFHKSIFLIALLSILMTGCSTILPAPTPTPTATFAPTIDAGATQTVQTQATGTAQADATRTAQAQATATAQAQATARAQATSTAQAAATATVQALIATVNAMSDSAPGKPYLSPDGTVNGQPAPYITAFNPQLNIKNFDAKVQILNPADRALHPWDYGFRFRVASPDAYDLIINSDGLWGLFLYNQNLADSVNGKLVASGVVKNLDVSTTGNNTLRLFAKDGSGYLFVNGEYISALDLSGLNSAGGLLISTGSLKNDNFPGLMLRYKNLSIKGLP